MRIALVADWLTTFGGAEHVIAEFRILFPDAPIFTTVARRGSLGELNGATIHTSTLQRWYERTHQHQILLPWMPRAIESLDLRGYDVVLSSSHAVAKGIIVDPATLHVCYCHTPVRYAWEMEEEYLRDFRVPHFLRRRVRTELQKIRRWDLTSAKRVDAYIANSTTTQERIQRTYARKSRVIAPPVDDRFFHAETPQPKTDPYFLAVGRFVPYKRFDLLIQLANELAFPLKIAGRGQDEKRLRALAGPTVEFLGFVPDAELPGLYAHADALLFPQYEDAGIVLLEAQATGTPVIAYRAGGATDMVVDGKTGIFFAEQTTDSLRAALNAFRTVTWNRVEIRTHARTFSQERFRHEILDVIHSTYASFHTGTFHRS